MCRWCPLLVQLCLLAGFASGQREAAPIERSEIERHLAAAANCEISAISIRTLIRFDFTGDGLDEIVVVASTCNTGTAGPDVHSVLSRSPRGDLVPMEIPEQSDRTVYDSLFGNRNSNLSVENGLLVRTWTDTSGRKAPLVIKYRWTGAQFATVSIEKSKPFPTSYACPTAGREVDRAVCHVASLARLDLELNAAYVAYLEALPLNDRDRARAEQGKWLGARESECVLYKGWVECLESYYQKRIGELRTAPH